MIQSLITYILLIAALLFLALKFRKSKKKDACDTNCGCKDSQM